MYHTARDVLRKAKLPKNGSCETILEIWRTDADCQRLLSDECWTEEKIRQYDALALEDYSCEATSAERVTMTKELENCFKQKEWKVK